MFKAIEQIKEAFEARGLKYQFIENEITQRIIAQMGGDSASYLFQFISTDDTNRVAVRVFDIITVPEHKKMIVLAVASKLNRINDSIAKFTLDDDNTITAGFDFPASFEPIGPGAIEVLFGMTEIQDAAYPKFAEIIAN